MSSERITVTNKKNDQSTEMSTVNTIPGNLAFNCHDLPKNEFQECWKIFVKRDSKADAPHITTRQTHPMTVRIVNHCFTCQSNRSARPSSMIMQQCCFDKRSTCILFSTVDSKSLFLLRCVQKKSSCKVNKRQWNSNGCTSKRTYQALNKTESNENSPMPVTG